MEAKKLNRIETCRFQREQDGQWEIGLLLNEGDLGILDLSGTIVTEMWTWERESYFVLNIGMLLDYIASIM